MPKDIPFSAHASKKSAANTLAGAYLEIDHYLYSKATKFRDQIPLAEREALLNIQKAIHAIETVQQGWLKFDTSFFQKDEKKLEDEKLLDDFLLRMREVHRQTLYFTYLTTQQLLLDLEKLPALTYNKKLKNYLKNCCNQVLMRIEQQALIKIAIKHVKTKEDSDETKAVLAIKSLKELPYFAQILMSAFHKIKKLLENYESNPVNGRYPAKQHGKAPLYESQKKALIDLQLEIMSQIEAIPDNWKKDEEYVKVTWTWLKKLESSIDKMKDFERIDMPATDELLNFNIHLKVLINGARNFVTRNGDFKVHNDEIQSYHYAESAPVSQALKLDEVYGRYLPFSQGTEPLAGFTDGVCYGHVDQWYSILKKGQESDLKLFRGNVKVVNAHLKQKPTYGEFNYRNETQFKEIVFAGIDKVWKNKSKVFDIRLFAGRQELLGDAILFPHRMGIRSTGQDEIEFFEPNGGVYTFKIKNDLVLEKVKEWIANKIFENSGKYLDGNITFNSMGYQEKDTKSFVPNYEELYAKKSTTNTVPSSQTPSKTPGVVLKIDPTLEQDQEIKNNEVSPSKRYGA